MVPTGSNSLADPRALVDPFYYLANFQAMLDTLSARDGDLLEADEREFIEAFCALPQRARALLVRMAMRKGTVFRASRLVYAEIGNLADAVRPLIALGWVDDKPRLAVDELSRVVTKTDLVHHLSLPPRLLSLSKAALLAQLRAVYPEPRSFEDWCAASGDRLFRLTIDPLCERLRLMFFGNSRQDLTEFVLTDLGVIRYERIELQLKSRPFQSRGQIENFLRLHRCREMLHAGADLAAIESALPASGLDCEWLEERRERLRFQVARAHERAGATQKALEIYSTCSHPEAATRSARILGRRHRVARRPTMAATAPTFELTVERSRSTRPVEYLVLDRLAAAAPPHDDAVSPGEASSVHYVENRLINSLFGLLCWRAIFAPVPGAFFHAFHRGPADLSSPGFFARREQVFSACFDELRSGAYRDTIRRCFRDKAGIASPFVAWGLIHARLLDLALTCFPASHLRRWFEWILRDVTVNRTGFPDLVQFWPQSGNYRLIEVKGPGDRLQDNQRRCLEFCRSHDMPVSVCHVRYSQA
jgi:hypothetical protein